MKSLIKILLTIIAFGSAFLYSIEEVKGDSAPDYEVDIEVSPGGYLYDVKDLKPGDWMPRTVVVQNNGEHGFDYVTSIVFQSGEKLFKELLLEVMAGEERLYNGKLGDFTELPIRHLEPGIEEELHFIVRFPDNLGNDYQGLETKFLFTFTAENFDEVEDGEEPGKGDPEEEPDVPVDGGGSDTDKPEQTNTDSEKGGPLPNTATNYFDFLLLGSVLVLIGGGSILFLKRNISDK